MKRAAVIALAISAFLPTAALAQPGEEPIVIDYHAPSSCPNSGAFTGQVRSRTGRFRPANESEPARRFTVEITATASAFAGHLSIRETDGRLSSRDLTANACDDVAAALALMTAVAIDPAASTAPLSTVVTAQPAPPPEPPPARTTVKPPPPPPQSMVAERGRWRAAAGIDGDASSGFAPTVVIGFRAFAEIAHTSQSWFRPSLRLAFERGASGAVDVTGGKASFVRIAGRLDVCPTRFDATAWLAALPCATAGAGALTADGSIVSRPASSTRPWVDAGFLGRAIITVVDRVFVEASGGVVFPLVRDRFHFEPAIPVYSIPIAAGTGSLGAGVLFL